MGKIVFECENITPMFMYGADGKTPELRPASIKGVMRFWWRAINGDLPLNDLRNRENKIFGNTEKKSSFSIRINDNLKDSNFKYLPHKNHTKKAFKPNQTFEITFIGKNLKLVENLFIIATTLGGFGQRSRRGFGSIQITEMDKIEEFIKTIPSFQHLKKSKNEQYPYIRKIEVGKKSYNNIDELLEKISKETHNNRCGKALFKDDRLASPIYVSILKFGEKDYRPIITTLNTVSEKYIDFKEMLKRQNRFKEAIL